MNRVLLFLIIAFFAFTSSANVLLDTVKNTLAEKAAGRTHTVVLKKAIPKNHYAIVLFFRSTCPHCQRFTPVLKAVAQKLHLYVYPYSTDGGTLPAYPAPLYATGEVRRLFFQGIPDVVPSIFMINTHTLGFHLLAQGEISKADLIRELTPYSEATV